MRGLLTIAAVVMLSAAAWGQSIVFDDAYVSGPTLSSFLAGGGLSVSFWVKMPSHSVSDEDTLISNWYNAPGDSKSDFLIRYDSVSNELEWFVRDSSGVFDSAVNAVSIEDNKWHHILCNFESGGSGVVYLDGVLLGNSLSLAGYVGTADHPVLVGLSPHAATDYLDGSIADPVRIYSYALTANEVAALYQKKAEVLNFLGSRDLTEVIDLSGNGNTGGITGIDVSLDGKDWILDCDGASKIEIGADVCPTGALPRSVLIWGYYDEGTRQTLFYAGEEASLKRFDIEMISGKCNLNWYNGTKSALTLLQGDAWNLFAVCYDGTNAYISSNGEAPATQAVALNTSAVGKNWIASLNGTAQPGRFPLSAVTVYDRCLSTNDTAAVYAAGETVAPSKTVPSGVVGEWDFTPALSAGMKVHPEQPDAMVADTTTVLDLSGNGWDSVFSSGTLLEIDSAGGWVANQAGLAVSLTANPFPAASNSVALSCWVKLASHLNAYPMKAGTEYDLHFDTGGGWNFGTWAVHAADASNPIPLNEWTHLVAIWDRTADTVDYYFNGAFDSQVAFSTEPGTAGVLEILRGAHPMNGMMDAARVYYSDAGVAMTGAQATNLYAAGRSAAKDAISTDNLVGFWPMTPPYDQALTEIPMRPSPLLPINAAIPDVWDSSGSGNHGSLEPDRASGPTWSGAFNGRYGVYDPDGSDDYIDIATTAITMRGKSTFTVCWWEYGTSYSVNPLSFLLETDSDANKALALYAYDDSAGDGFRAYYNGANYLNENGATRTGWNHFAFVSYSSTDHRLVVNGVEVKSGSTSKTLDGSLNRARIAGDSIVGQYSPNNIDGFQIFDSALTTNQLYQIAVNDIQPTNTTILRMTFDDIPYEWPTYDGQHTITAYPEGTAGPTIGE